MTPIKRLSDVVVAAAGLLILSPVFVVVSVLIMMRDGRPVLYRSKRIGYRGRPFDLWKFRTMHVHEGLQRTPITIGDDPRITPLGAVLRRYKIDELPQLFNVLVGEMSLVGPRPEDPALVAEYTPEQRCVLELVPGITDPASIRYSDEGQLLAKATDPMEEYVEGVMPEKIRINLEYAARATFASDLGVILRTLGQILSQGRRARRT